MSKPMWIARDYAACSGCKRCEIACSWKHEGWMWPEASRVRVFMPFPGVEVPHLCAQCKDYPCVASCPVQALSTDAGTGAVIAMEVMRSRQHSPMLRKMIRGFMIESFIEEGAQKVDGGVYGKSITDPCLGWKESEKLIRDLAAMG